MITDEIIPLVETGVITGNQKSMDRGKIVTSFAMGTKKLYDFVDNNPPFSFNPTEYVNNPFIIRPADKMVAINTALEVDLTGQVCSDSPVPGSTRESAVRPTSTRAQVSPTVDAPSSHCRPRPKEAKVSRIVPTLQPGAGVVTTRGAVHYVVTEYGVAYLHGKSIQEESHGPHHHRPTPISVRNCLPRRSSTSGSAPSWQMLKAASSSGPKNYVPLCFSMTAPLSASGL
jgi:acyl-CoA hydrolase